ncbi:MAG TPA: DUF4159 domain-containing protein [Verrucomicrobiota bacterium]|nr:transmembrane prediction [Verrucomicrobiales bacterium]HRI12008.1 DUF4159 domain-containing protein [Verrucomicrobiota bacterium]
MRNFRWGVVGALSLCAGLLLAQRAGFGGFRGGGEIEVPEGTRTAREVDSRSTGTPPWTNAPGFERDVFTFARLRYDKEPGRPYRWGGGGFTTDFPDSDLNLSFRIQQMTSIKVDPDGRLIRLNDPELPNYPMLFVSAPGALHLTDPEAAALRQYLLGGGFMLMDDFWGEREWQNCENVMKEVLPEHHFIELPLDHPVYHCVFEIKDKYQCANVRMGIESEQTGVTWEREDGHVVHHRAILDAKGRIMVMTLHNTDTGDGWEREGESDYYFHNFSEKIAYPLGINIIFYAMTH